MKRALVAILGLQTRNGPDAAGATRQMRPPGGPDAAGAKRTRQSPHAAGAPPHRKALERNRAAVPLEVFLARVDRPLQAAAQVELPVVH